MHVCPTTATRKRADGIVSVDYDLCIGCAYCDVACPYQARFKIDEPAFAYGGAMQNEAARSDPRRIGVSQKCTFCSDRIDFGVANGLVPGVDPQATPACVNACIADALHFGDVDDPNSNVSKLLATNSSFRMHAELGTDPNFHYLHDRRHTPVLTSDPQVVRGEDVEPKHQKHWDWKAALNFILGGSGASLLLFSAVYDEMTGILAALTLIAIGLGALLFKIGRPLRSLYVLRQPRRSWMSREAWIAGVLFPLGLLSVALSSQPLAWAAAASAAGFLFAQAMILQQAKGIAAWRTPWIVPLIILTGLAEGAALMSPFHLIPPLVLGVVTACRGLAWWAYARALSESNSPSRTREVIRKCAVWFYGIGLVLPIALIAADLTSIAAAVVLVSGYALKFILVTRAAYQQGFSIQRAHGIVHPGWQQVRP
jgi:Fe-S-cluster-containing dehydrogenase component/DMSO reductase anchor subunit